MRRFFLLFAMIVLCTSQFFSEEQKVTVGIDRIFSPPFDSYLKDKRIGLVTNHTGVNSNFDSTISLFKAQQKQVGFVLKALFSPEHGLYGEGYANEKIDSKISEDGIPIYSLHGTTRRPTKKMLKDIDVIVYDIQDIGTRSYTFASTLYYVMEEAAKENIPVIVLDRPNPINGLTVDGPMLDPAIRSFVGYINVPYCHGMTIAELARLFNEEYKIGCKLLTVPMKGWKRSMTFLDTGLPWIPTSPNIPESSTTYYYPTTGILGEISLISIGVGYTLPFKVIGAPWLQSNTFIQALRKYSLAGVQFYPIHFKPFFGKFSGKACQGALIIVTDHILFKPMKTQYAILSALKKLNPQECNEIIRKHTTKESMMSKVCGTTRIAEIMLQEENPFDKLCRIHLEQNKKFLETRTKYLLPEYE